MRSIFVLTHDSIGLGEDGPTHQPIEHLPSLRLIPNMTRLAAVRYRRDRASPGRDAIERRDGPTLPRAHAAGSAARSRARAEQIAAIRRGGYMLKDCEGTPADHPDRHGLRGAARGRTRRALLRQEGVARARRFDAVHAGLFDAQDASYRDHVLPPQVERARRDRSRRAPDSWWRYVGPRGAVVGIDSLRRTRRRQGAVRAFRFTRRAIVVAAIAEACCQ